MCFHLNLSARNCPLPGTTYSNFSSSSDLSCDLLACFLPIYTLHYDQRQHTCKPFIFSSTLSSLCLFNTFTDTYGIILIVISDACCRVAVGVINPVSAPERVVATLQIEHAFYIDIYNLLSLRRSRDLHLPRLLRRRRRRRKVSTRRAWRRRSTSTSIPTSSGSSSSISGWRHVQLRRRRSFRRSRSTRSSSTSIHSSSISGGSGGCHHLKLLLGLRHYRSSRGNRSSRRSRRGFYRCGSRCFVFALRRNFAADPCCHRGHGNGDGDEVGDDLSTQGALGFDGGGHAVEGAVVADVVYLQQVGVDLGLELEDLWGRDGGREGKESMSDITIDQDFFPSSLPPSLPSSRSICVPWTCARGW